MPQKSKENSAKTWERLGMVGNGLGWSRKVKNGYMGMVKMLGNGPE